MIHAVSSFTRAWLFVKAKIALLFFTIGISSEKIALPIIGPPMRIFLGSCLYPPQKAITSLIMAPIGAMMFFGCATASPSTVILFEISGIPVLKYSPTLAKVVTLERITPISAGRTPASIVFPVIS